MQLEKRLKVSEAFLHDLKMTSTMQIENLEKEKHQFEYAIKRLMQELEEKEGQNNVLSEKIVHLETSLNEKK